MGEPDICHLTGLDVFLAPFAPPSLRQRKDTPLVLCDTSHRLAIYLLTHCGRGAYDRVASLFLQEFPRSGVLTKRNENF